jgi:hypothetical protein
MGRQELDNRANQMNPNNDAYWQSRGDDERPDDWQQQVPPSKSPEEDKQRLVEIKQLLDEAWRNPENFSISKRIYIS